MRVFGFVMILIMFLSLHFSLLTNEKQLNIIIGKLNTIQLQTANDNWISKDIRHIQRNIKLKGK